MTYVDSCALRLVLEPSVFDVMVTENLFGDILSDEAGAIVGSLGLLPSASIGGRIGLFEPVHGSAPTLVGTNSANPVGAIASAAMLLEYGLGVSAAAQTIDAAIGRAFADGCVTKDLAAGQVRPLTCSRDDAGGSRQAIEGSRVQRFKGSTVPGSTVPRFQGSRVQVSRRYDKRWDDSLKRRSAACLSRASAILPN